MRHAFAWGAVFAAGVLAGALSGEFVHAQGAQYVTKQVLKTDLNNLPGQELLIFESIWQPGFRLPLHVHPNGSPPSCERNRSCRRRHSAGDSPCEG